MEEEDNITKTIPISSLPFLPQKGFSSSSTYVSHLANLLSLFLSSDTVTGEAEELTWSIFLH